MARYSSGLMVAAGHAEVALGRHPVHPFGDRTAAGHLGPSLAASPRARSRSASAAKPVRPRRPAWPPSGRRFRHPWPWVSISTIPARGASVTASVMAGTGTVVGRQGAGGDHQHDDPAVGSSVATASPPYAGRETTSGSGRHDLGSVDRTHTCSWAAISAGHARLCAAASKTTSFAPRAVTARHRLRVSLHRHARARCPDHGQIAVGSAPAPRLTASTPGRRERAPSGQRGTGSGVVGDNPYVSHESGLLTAT